MIQTVALFAALAFQSGENAKPGPAGTKVVTPLPVASTAGSKTVDYAERDIVSIAARLRFTTMIVLPKNEQILDFVVGDKEFWVVNGVQNFCFVKPAKAGTQTNLNLITATGVVYSFVLTEIGATGTSDMKVFIQPTESNLLSQINGEAKFVPASAVRDFEAQWKMAKEQERITKEQADLKVLQVLRDAAEEKQKARAAAPAALKFGYRFKKEKDDQFAVSEIYRDDKFTYIKASPRETPAVYELKNGRPSLINFEFHDGLYTLDKVVTDGYLAIGKKKLPFQLEESSK
jgi:type IV secretory pathway VirB9-like protein